MAPPKIIPYEVQLRSVRPKVDFSRPPVVYTNDLRSAEFQFKITDMDASELLTATAKTMLYMRDGSFFQNPSTDVSRVGNVFSYLLKENEGNHAGIAKIQLVVYFNEGLANEQNFPTQLYEFEIINGLETKVAQEVMIYDWTTLTRDARAYIDQFVADEILREAEYDNAQFDRNDAFNAAQTQRVIAFNSSEAARVRLFNSAENARAAAESARVTEYAALASDLTDTLAAADANIENFDVALQTGIIGENIAAELQNLEETYAPRLLSAEQQLAETDTKADTAILKADAMASGSPKAVFETLAALETAHPTGTDGAYLVTANGNWYYWSGTAWVSGGVYQATSLDVLSATNRVVNGDFDSVRDPWSANRGTTTILENVVTLTGDGTNKTPHIIQNVGTRDMTHKYYTKVSVRAITEGVQLLYVFNTISYQIANPVLNQWYDIDGISLPPTNNPYIGVFFDAVDAASSLGKKIEIKYATEIDLSETYGIGNEPDLSEMRTIISRFQNKWFDGSTSLFDGQRVYAEIETLKTKKVSIDDVPNGLLTGVKIANHTIGVDNLSISKNTKNLFDGNYEHWWLYGGLEYPHIAPLESGRMAVIAITPLESYTISVYGEKDAFRIATAATLPVFDDGIFIADDFLIYNDVGRQFTFTNNATANYLFVNVSETGQEPLIQIEKNKVATEYTPHEVINSLFVEKQTDTMIDFLPTLTNAVFDANPAGPRLIDFFDGKMWGYKFDGGLYYSTNEGFTWTAHTITWDHLNWGWIQRLVPTSDGEMLAVSETNIRKSIGWASGTVTWSENKVVPNTNCVFPIFGFDGDGTKFIIVQYAPNSANWSYSRYVHVSLDSGTTFTQVFDSLVRHGEVNNALTHLHAGCYDKWADRFYFSEGHSPAGGLYYSDDDGLTWKQGQGHRDGVLYSQGIVDKVGDTNGPTVLIATDDGIVMGSDNQNNGVFGMVRRNDADDEVVKWIYQTSYERKGVQMFAQRGWRDPASGTVYITFRTEWNDVPPIIVACNAKQAKLVYEYPHLPVVGGADRFMAIAKTSDDRIVTNAEFDGAIYTMRADLKHPNTEVVNIIRAELKRLGLIP